MVVGALCVSGSVASAVLTHEYKFDAPTLDGTDTSGSGNNGTLVGGATVITSGNNFVGGSLGLRQGTGTWPLTQSGLEMPPAAPSADITMAAWIRLERIPESPEAFIFGWANTTGSNPNFQLRINGGSRVLQLGRWDGSGFAAFNSGLTATAVPLNEWTHVAATLSSGGAGAVYVNGALAGTGTIANGNLGAGPFTAWVGTMQLGASNFIRPFEGQMDNVQIWNNVLTGSEVAALVPEPTSALLGLLGVAGLGTRRRR
jgi:MYXO-CTERM domain-containing protein